MRDAQEADTQAVWKTLLSGACAGVASKSVVAPIERLKVIVQTAGMRKGPRPSPLQAAGLILHKDGFLGFYKGNGANCLRVIPVHAIKFTLNDHLSVAATHAERLRLGLPRGAAPPKLSFSTQLAAGCTAGAVQILVTYPLDLARTRLQLSEMAGANYRGIFHCLSDTFTREGPSALYKGLAPSLVAGVPYVGLQMSFYARLKAAPLVPRRADGQPTLGALLACGSLAGIASQTLCYPLDTVRHRMQADGLGGSVRVYAGAWDCVRLMAKKEGPRGFFRGWLLNTLRALPGAATQFAVFDSVKRLLSV